MHVEWSVLPRGDVAPHWSLIYVSINREGVIKLSGNTYGRMGEPAAFLVLFDKTNSRIALRPTGATMKNAYPARKVGKRKSRTVRAWRLLTEYGIKITETLEFKDAEIDFDGQLILDLRTARVSARCRRPKNDSGRLDQVDL